MSDQVVGHTRNGEQVCIRQAPAYYLDVPTIDTIIEIGRKTYLLDHLDPELIPALTRSLQRPPQAAA